MQSRSFIDNSHHDPPRCSRARAREVQTASRSLITRCRTTLHADSKKRPQNTIHITRRRSKRTRPDRNRHRYYHPQLGRFVSRDPIEYQDTLNVYHYTGSNPCNRTDPTGLVGDGLHHWYPLYLGGANEGAMTYLEKEMHLAAHQYFQSQGIGFWGKGTVEEAQARWRALSPRTRMKHIKMSMRRAGLSPAKIRELMPAVRASELNPGVKTIRTGAGFGKTAIPIGVGFSAALYVLLDASPVYAAETSWRMFAREPLPGSGSSECGVCRCTEYVMTTTSYAWYTFGIYDLMFGSDDFVRDRKRVASLSFEGISAYDCLQLEGGVMSEEPVYSNIAAGVYESRHVICDWQDSSGQRFGNELVPLDWID